MLISSTPERDFATARVLCSVYPRKIFAAAGCLFAFNKKTFPRGESGKIAPRPTFPTIDEERRTTKKREEEEEEEEKGKEMEAREKRNRPSSFLRPTRAPPGARIVGVNELITEREESRVCASVFLARAFRFLSQFNFCFFSPSTVPAHVTSGDVRVRPADRFLAFNANEQSTRRSRG